MIKPICDRCKSEMQDFGGLLFSPPKTLIDGSQNVIKQHVCVDCFSSLSECMKEAKCSATESLIIRLCKSNKPSFAKFQKVLAIYAWCDKKQITKNTLFYKLVDLLIKFKLHHNEHYFIFLLDAISQKNEEMKGFDLGNTTDVQIIAMIRLIRNAPVSLFPEFRSSAWFRNNPVTPEIPIK